MENVQISAVRLNMQALKSIDQFLEGYYEEGNSQRAGRAMAGCGMKNSQVRGLENLIAATSRFSEVINYIKNQIGKNRSEWQSAGPILLTQLETIESKAAEIAGADPAVKMEVKLRLVRGWARQVVAHYLYDRKTEGGPA
jgi:hypothetical protein